MTTLSQFWKWTRAIRGPLSLLHSMLSLAGRYCLIHSVLPEGAGPKLVGRRGDGHLAGSSVASSSCGPLSHGDMLWQCLPLQPIQNHQLVLGCCSLEEASSFVLCGFPHLAPLLCVLSPLPQSPHLTHRCQKPLLSRKGQQDSCASLPQPLGGLSCKSLEMA